MRTLCAGPGEPGLVSVIIPTYNRAYIIGRSIDSVLAQTYRPIELIIVDDGSTDDTAEVVRRYGDEVRYIHQHNAGVAAARNTGFAAARGEFIALLDSDDYWYPWKIELQIAFLQRHPDVGMVWTDMKAVTNDGAPVAEAYLRTFYKAYEHFRTEDIMTRRGTVRDLGVAVPPGLEGQGLWTGEILSPLLRGTLVHTPTTLLRRDRVRATGGYDESLTPNGEDYDFHLRTAAVGSVGFLDVSAIEYRIGNDDQLTAPSYSVGMARNYLRTVEYWLEREAHRITLPQSDLRAIVAYAHEWVGRQELVAGNARAARRHLWRSIRLKPAQLKTAAFLVLGFFPPQLLRSARHARRRLRTTPAAT